MQMQLQMHFEYFLNNTIHLGNRFIDLFDSQGTAL